LHEVYGDLYVMDTMPKTGFRLLSYDAFWEENTVVYVHEVTQDLADVDVSTQERLNTAATWLSRPYDYRNILHLVFRAFCRRRMSTPRSMQCAESVVRFAPELFTGLDPEDVTPQTLMEVLQSHRHEE
jgi:hypothetical protein